MEHMEIKSYRIEGIDDETATTIIAIHCIIFDLFFLLFNYYDFTVKSK